MVVSKDERRSKQHDVQFIGVISDAPRLEVALIKIISLLAGIFLLASCGSTNTSFPTGSLGNPYKHPKTVSGLLILPEGDGPFPAVVLLHTCGGLRPHVTQDWPDYLTDLGYAVLTVDSFGPRGVSSCTKLKFGKVFQAEDAFGALEYLVTLPSIDAARIGVMGFSTGAIAINRHIVTSVKKSSEGANFKAAIALYGTCWGISGYRADSVPLMEIAAENDVNHAPTCIAAGKTNPGIEVHVLPGANHAFDSHHRGGRYDSGGSYMQYSQSATDMARQLTKKFFAKHLGT